MDKIRSRLEWIDKNLLFILSAFLLAFIPLYPKIPLFDALPGYIVKVRFEDFFVILTGVVWLRDVLKKRIEWNTSYFWFVCFYAVAGFVSIVLGVALLQTIPFQLLHIGKSGLHFFRYLEYFSVFFFLFAAIKTTRQIILSVAIIVTTLFGVVGFGLGQKYAHFPVYSTMNREYSKGEKLYLQDGAKPQSTFAGHYDLAAYLVIILPILFSLALGKIRRPFPIRSGIITGILFFAHLAGLFMLILTASATALGGYGVAMLLVIVLHLLQLPTKKQRILWAGASLLFGIVGVASVWMIAPQHTKDKALGLFTTPESSVSPNDLIGNGYVDKIIETRQPDGSIKTETVKEKSTWSANALKYGISMGIRLDTLWPQALLGLARSPLSGSGYGTLAMLDTKGFTEADSTDNNFLRTLGETGILGFVTFYGIIFFIAIKAYKASKTKDLFVRTFSIGFFGSVAGLLITAIYLDVFAASKVAFTFWALSGIILKGYYLTSSNSLSKSMVLQPMFALSSHLKAFWPLYVTLILTAFLLHQNPFLVRTPNKNSETMQAGLENIASARCFLSRGSFSLCRNSGVIIAPHFSLYSVLLVPFFTMTKVYGVFSYLNLLIVLVVCFGIFLSLRKKTDSTKMLFILMSGVGIASIFHLTQYPLSNLQFAILILGFPLVAFAINRVPKIKWPLGLCILAVLSFSVYTNPLLPRYRPIATNDAAESVMTANQILPRTTLKKSYLITSLNPFFVDLYTSNTYSLLPLSPRQTYAKQNPKVWDTTVSPELIQTADVYVSDINAQSNEMYAPEFESLGNEYDLNYVRLGCDERCNVYSVHPSTPLISRNPVSIINSKPLSTESLGSSYRFAVINNIFSQSLQDSTITYDTRVFAQRLEPLAKTTQNFMILTGDAVHKPEKVHAGFVQNVANRTSYPILFAQGNEKLLPEKYFDGSFQTFFTKNEYFILLDVDPQSRIPDDERLLLYDAFLQLKKLPNIKSLFIIAHDLNWQNSNDPENVMFAIQAKLVAFPNLSTYILTANHANDLVTTKNWFATKQEGFISYSAALTAGNSRDVYLKASVQNGKVTILPTPLNLPQ